MHLFLINPPVELSGYEKGLCSLFCCFNFFLIMSAYVWCMCARVQDLQKAKEGIISSGANEAAVSSLMWVLGLRTSAKISTFSYLLSHPIHVHFHFVLLETVLKKICSILLPSNISQLPSLSHIILSIYLFLLMVGVVMLSTANFLRNIQVYVTKRDFFSLFWTSAIVWL